MSHARVVFLQRGCILETSVTGCGGNSRESSGRFYATPNGEEMWIDAIAVATDEHIPTWRRCVTSNEASASVLLEVIRRFREESSSRTPSAGGYGESNVLMSSAEESGGSSY